VHHALHVRGHAHDHRVVQPRGGVQLGLAVEPGIVLRAMTAAARLSPQTVVVIVVGVMAGLFLLILGGSFLKVRRPAPTAAAAPAPPTSRPTTPVSRRDFFRGGLLASAMVFAAQFAGASIAFLWPNLTG